MFTFSSSVPAAVLSLRARSGNQSDALLVNWDRGGGDLSGYLLSLYNPNGSERAKQQLESEVTEFVFSDLVPGRLYRAEVLSLSGELSNKAETLGRTGEMRGHVLDYHSYYVLIRAGVVSHLIHVHPQKII